MPPCEQDILAALRKAGRPLTKSLLLEAMLNNGTEWSERTVDKYLKVLMDEGMIENPPDARPRGYRLPKDE